MEKILLIEDNDALRDNTAEILTLAGYEVISAENGKIGVEKAMANPPDLIVCDIMMPVLDGYGVYQIISKNEALQHIPFIFLSAKSERNDLRKGMEMGADDYITKPFSQRLLIARVKAILRRATYDKAIVNGEAGSEPEPMTRGKLEMDPARHQVKWDGRSLMLTVTEFMILEALAIRPGVVRTRDQLMDAAYQDDVYVDDRTIDSHIKRLRRKFREIDPEFTAIDTLYGAGYRFADS